MSPLASWIFLAFIAVSVIAAMLAIFVVKDGKDRERHFDDVADAAWNGKDE
jgi:hypothetical protein